MCANSRSGLSNHSVALNWKEGAPCQSGNQRQAINPISWYIGSHETTPSSEEKSKASRSRASCDANIGAVTTIDF